MTAAVARAVGGLTSIAMALLTGHLSVPSLTPTPGGRAGPRAAAAPFPGLSPSAPIPDAAGVSARLSGPLGRGLLGGPRAAVVDATTGTVLLDVHADAPAVPASTVKTVTAAAALTTFTADDRITTRVAYSGGSQTGGTSTAGTGTAGTGTGGPTTAPPTNGGGTARDGTARDGTLTGGTLWLIGAGDPTLTAATGPPGYPSVARLADLATQVRRSGVTSVDRVVGDGSLFTGPATAPGWRESYRVTGNITPVSALEVDGGRPAAGSTAARASDPAWQAADEFATALRSAGVTVGPTSAAGTAGSTIGTASTVGTGVAPAGARTVASVRSPTIPVLVERMLTNSDDDQAEAMGRLVARAEGLPATFAGATQALERTLRSLGVPTTGLRLADASGLSPQDRITPRTLVALLRTAVLAGHDNLRPLLSGLPVAGFSGTLADRYRLGPGAAGAGDVRAKTGSLSEATALAGQVVDADGRLLLFAFLAPVAQSDATSAALDQAATALSACGCNSRR